MRVQLTVSSVAVISDFARTVISRMRFSVWYRQIVLDLFYICECSEVATAGIDEVYKLRDGSLRQRAQSVL
jgi:hypothetical protein